MARQRLLGEALRRLGLRGAVLADRRHVHYFTGYWCRELFSPLLWVDAGGAGALSAPRPPDRPVFAEIVEVYESHRSATLVDDQFHAAWTVLSRRVGPPDRIGSDRPLRGIDTADLMPELRRMRRTKHDDEVAMLTFCLRASEAAYVAARRMIADGLDEMALWAQMHAAAAVRAGETLGEFGNDFQVGSLDSPPRRRPMRTGELAVLDLGVSVRGYHGDMCRSFVVGGRPDDRHSLAHRRVAEALRFVEQEARPGAGCRDIFQKARAMLHGHEGWTFEHHLGHGVGLDPHEAPRFNPHWDERLEVGDVFTFEPGLYGADLRAGLRIEQVYHLSPHGLRRLTEFPIDL
jgi:Xaa-Pro aminopeptidase